MYDKKNPFLAKLVERRRLSTEESEKETFHFSVDIGGSGMEFSCGDSLGVFPENDPQAVERLLGLLGFGADEKVTHPKTGEELELGEALLTRFAISNPSPLYLTFYREHLKDVAECERLDTLLEDKEELKEYCANRELEDIAEEFRSAEFGAQAWVEKLRPLQPRLYSVASSPVVNGDRVDLTVAVLRYQTNGKERLGVATTYLADRVEMGSPSLPVFVASSHFRLPEDPAADVIMVGPGTGIAPFRAFLQERKALGHTGRNWLFFGEQRRACDFLYEEELRAFESEGVLNRMDLAFSRDQAHKIYVQDKMAEAAGELWQWLEGGAFFYVCGDAKRMAKDVDACLHTIAQEHGGMDEAGAQAFVKELKKAKRYQRDVY